MVFDLRIAERVLLATIVLTLGVSTGVASIAHHSLEGVTGHTAYVSGEILVEPRPDPDATPILYGLATHRETFLFGLVANERPTAPSHNRLVFVWSADAPDPREDDDLAPTGSWGRIMDRLGVSWTIHEYRYGPADAPHHAYATALQKVRDAGEAEIGASGHYNHVLSYRPDRLAPDDQDALRIRTGVGPAPAAATAA